MSFGDKPLTNERIYRGIGGVWVLACKKHGRTILQHEPRHDEPCPVCEKNEQAKRA